MEKKLIIVVDERTTDLIEIALNSLAKEGNRSISYNGEKSTFGIEFGKAALVFAAAVIDSQKKSKPASEVPPNKVVKNGKKS